MPVDVDPVGDRDERVVGDDQRLEPGLPGDAERALETRDRCRVGERAIDPSLGHGPHAEVHDDREEDERTLPQHRP